MIFCATAAPQRNFIFIFVAAHTTGFFIRTSSRRLAFAALSFSISASGR
jgi:hypothetical protein